MEYNQKLKMPGPVSAMDLVHNAPESDATADPVYVGDPQADDVKPRRDNLKIYGRKFQR